MCLKITHCVISLTSNKTSALLVDRDHNTPFRSNKTCAFGKVTLRGKVGTLKGEINIKTLANKHLRMSIL